MYSPVAKSISAFPLSPQSHLFLFPPLRREHSPVCLESIPCLGLCRNIPLFLSCSPDKCMPRKSVNAKTFITGNSDYCLDAFSSYSDRLRFNQTVLFLEIPKEHCFKLNHFQCRSGSKRWGTWVKNKVHCFYFVRTHSHTQHSSVKRLITSSAKRFDGGRAKMQRIEKFSYPSVVGKPAARVHTVSIATSETLS